MLLALDPGPTQTGYANVRAAGGRATFVSGGLARSCRRELVPLLEQAEAVALEVPRGPIFAPYRGPTIIATAGIACAIAWEAERLGKPVVEFTAGEVRKALCGKANANDHAVADVVRGNVVDFPARSNEHVRDACALAVVGAWKFAGQIGARV